MSQPAKHLDDALADALRQTRDSLLGWMEIQDKGDARDYDRRAVRAASKALAAYEAKQSAETDTASLVQALRDKGLVIVVWSAADVPDGVDGDPQAWLDTHARAIADTCVSAGNEMIEELANDSNGLRPR